MKYVKISIRPVFFLAITMLCAVFVLAQVPDPLPNTYVNDVAKVLTSEQVHNLNEKILSIEKKSSVQIAVVLINELPGNMEIDQYALEIGRKWHVGNAKNGLVYVAAINQHKQRLEVANNLQGDIPDVTALKITDNIKPYFRNKDYYGGINELLNGINERVDPVVKEQMRLAAIEQEKKKKDNENSLLTVLAIIIGLGVIAGLSWFFYFLPIKKRKKKEEEDRKEKERKESSDRALKMAINNFPSGRKYTPTNTRKTSYDTPIPPVIIVPTETPKPYKSSYDDSSSSSSSNSSSSGSDSSSYGNWGSGSSDSSSSSDSGFSGGGSSNDW